MVQKQTEAINDWLESHQEEIKAGLIRVYALDECHVRGGDICGYLWANRQERGEVVVENYRESQSYFGALDCVRQQMTIQGAKTANSQSTIKFIESLRAECGGAKI